MVAVVVTVPTVEIDRSFPAEDEGLELVERFGVGPAEERALGGDHLGLDARVPVHPGQHAHVARPDPPAPGCRRHLGEGAQCTGGLGPPTAFLGRHLQHVAGVGGHRTVPVDPVDPAGIDGGQVVDLGGADQAVELLPLLLSGQHVTGGQ